MSTGIETVDIIEPWLYQTLSGDAALAELVGDRITGAITPDIPGRPTVGYGQEGAYVTFSLSSVQDVRGVGGSGRFMVDALYLVKAILQTTSQDEIAPVARRIDQLLHNVSATTTNGALTCVRRTIISYPEVIQGVPYLHLGGIYNIVAHSL